MAHVEHIRRMEPQFSFGLRVFITLAILFLVSMLARITAPGIDAQALETSTGYSPLDATARASTSIIALRFSPIASALVLFEVFKLTRPRMNQGPARDAKPPWRLNRALLLAAFALALFQGWGVASALEGVKTTLPLVPEPGETYRFTFALTQMAGTAALAVLAEAITFWGIGSGYWIMVAWFGLTAALPALADFAGGLRDGSISTLSAAALGLAIATGAAGAIALYRKGAASGQPLASCAADVVLPPFLGVAAGSLLYSLGAVATAFLTRGPLVPHGLLGAVPVELAVIVAAIFLLSLLRVQDRSRALQIAAFASALTIAFDYAATVTSTAPLPGDVIMIAAVVCALGFDQTRSGPHS